VSVAGGRGKARAFSWADPVSGFWRYALPLINISPFWQQFIQGS
jgi:ribose/xylose/arabinose/galactoside ABC-type transport system permease subunit